MMLFCNQSCKRKPIDTPICYAYNPPCDSHTGAFTPYSDFHAFERAVSHCIHTRSNKKTNRPFRNGSRKSLFCLTFISRSTASAGRRIRGRGGLRPCTFHRIGLVGNNMGVKEIKSCLISKMQLSPFPPCGCAISE